MALEDFMDLGGGGDLVEAMEDFVGLEGMEDFEDLEAMEAFVGMGGSCPD